MYRMMLYLVALMSQSMVRAPLPNFRPPSVPLVTIDPLVSIWSMSETLFGGATKQWDSTPKTIEGIIKVDNDSYRFMGEPSTDDRGRWALKHQFPLLAMQQVSLTVWPTRTIYEFRDPHQKVLLTVQFTTPLLPNWDIASMPVTYVTYTVASIDGRPHRVKLNHRTTSVVAPNLPDGSVDWTDFRLQTSQAIVRVMNLEPYGELSDNFDLKNPGLDWRSLYVAVTEDASVKSIKTEGPPPYDPMRPFLNVVWSVTVYPFTNVTKYVTMALDESYSVNFFGRLLVPYWKTIVPNGDLTALLRKAIELYDFVLNECKQFDDELVRDLEARGGAKYATLAALAYRQAMASTKLVWNDQLQVPWAFLRAPSINEDLSTVDVIAPASPLFLHVDPHRLQALLLPVLAYANNETGGATYNYPYPWAPHHLGVYPVANILPAEQLNMPMEESGNVLLMLAAITRRLGGASIAAWYPKYWSLLQRWVDQLQATLPDLGMQDWTDLFHKSPPHNANLAVKGILGLGAFSQLCVAVGEYDLGALYRQRAAKLALQWVMLARDGDHYKMSYNQNGTWSLKYNLFYEKVLGLRLFPLDVVTDEMQFYINKQLKPFGVPLDSRVTDTKLDWLAWVAAMTDNVAYQQELINRMYNWANATLPMTPLTDWYDTITGKQMGFTARPVVGALYSLMVV